MLCALITGPSWSQRSRLSRKNVVPPGVTSNTECLILPSHIEEISFYKDLVLLLRYAQKAVHSCFSWNAPITLLYWTMNYLYGGLLYQNADFVSWWNPKLVNRRSEKYGRFFSMLYYFKYARQLHEENCFKLWFHTNNNSKMIIDKIIIYNFTCFKRGSSIFSSWSAD